MKAYSTFMETPCEGCLLVWSETRNDARYTASLSPWGWEYLGISAIRQPDFDQYYRGLGVAECNDDLPAEAPNFYLEEAPFLAPTLANCNGDV